MSRSLLGQEIGMIEGIAGILIWTDNVERLSSFYRDKLRLQPYSIKNEFVAFKWGDMRLSLGKHQHVKGESRDSYRIMINLSTTDIMHTYEELRCRDVEFIRPPEQEHWGGWVSTFRDPDGNILQLLEQPE